VAYAFSKAEGVDTVRVVKQPSNQGKGAAVRKVTQGTAVPRFLSASVLPRLGRPLLFAAWLPPIVHGVDACSRLLPSCIMHCYAFSLAWPCLRRPLCCVPWSPS